ncbi:hypothetical protein [Caloranaerobacter ferrireducens]|uniref:hypothetical protein n=1 Tax=Caloranaerobacter ferrireducens TaxID=1323370 RepID=UPI00114C8D69|nr:hypothetical protein [Caloranaerobacter ferrireducens]
MPNTITVGPYINNYKTLNDALNAVANSGTIYILYKSTPYLFENIEINKWAKDSKSNLTGRNKVKK